MRTSATTESPAQTAADTVVVGVFEEKGVAHDTPGGELTALLDSGEARRRLGSIALTHVGGKRHLLVGLGPRERFDGERARRTAAGVHDRARDAGAAVLAWEVPHRLDASVVEGLVHGTLLAGYRFSRFRAADAEADSRQIQELVLSAHDDLEETVRRATVVAEAVNRARDLQNRPGNDLTPSALGEHARALAAQVDGLEVEVEGREGLVARRMGAFAAVAQGSYEEPALITLRYDGPGASGPVLGLIGKGVTFDSGGISIKPSAGMADMKFDMSGGAAVIEAIGAIARLGLPVRIVGVVGATENLPSGRSVKPGDIVTAKSGLTVEVNNTDAEGRLVLADCISHALEQGAERLVDVATLTGAVVIALGSTHAAVMSNDDAWAAELIAAGARSGEILWRLPLHEEYADMVKGRYGDLTNMAEERKAGTIIGAEFLHRFVADDIPWAHVDIAGSAWNLGRPYAQKGGSGYGVRLLVELARAHGAAGGA